jgi:hypothetical protein
MPIHGESGFFIAPSKTVLGIIIVQQYVEVGLENSMWTNRIPQQEGRKRKKRLNWFGQYSPRARGPGTCTYL